MQVSVLSSAFYARSQTACSQVLGVLTRDAQDVALALMTQGVPPKKPKRTSAPGGACSVFLAIEGGEVIQLHIEGSLTIPKTGIKRVLV